MRSFVRRQTLYVLAGFVVTFLVYLFVKFDTSEVIQGVGIGAAGGLGLGVLMFILERRFPENKTSSNT